MPGLDFDGKSTHSSYSEHYAKGTVVSYIAFNALLRCAFSVLGYVLATSYSYYASMSDVVSTVHIRLDFFNPH